MTAAVRRLEGCLAYLPQHVRSVLELRAGINVQPALTASGIAERLHLTLRRVYRLERLGLRGLSRSARTHTCAPAAASSSSQPTLLSAFGPSLAEEAPTAGGVEAGRYAKSPVPEATPEGSAPTTSGISAPPRTGVALLVFLSALGGLLLIGLLFADGLASWAIRRDRRTSRLHHHPWNWRK